MDSQQVYAVGKRLGRTGTTAVGGNGSTVVRTRRDRRGGRGHGALGPDDPQRSPPPDGRRGAGCWAATPARSRERITGRRATDTDRRTRSPGGAHQPGRSDLAPALDVQKFSESSGRTVTARLRRQPPHRGA